MSTRLASRWRVSSSPKAFTRVVKFFLASGRDMARMTGLRGFCKNLKMLCTRTNCQIQLRIIDETTCFQGTGLFCRSGPHSVANILIAVRDFLPSKSQGRCCLGGRSCLLVWGAVPSFPRPGDCYHLCLLMLQASITAFMCSHSRPESQDSRHHTSLKIF